jgi:fatty acid desaturase 2 (delta-6 desaturase)
MATPQSNSEKKQIRIHDWIYDVSTFIHRHPGGRRIIESQLSQQGQPISDATEAFDQFHPPHSQKPLKILKMMQNQGLAFKAEGNDNELLHDFRLLTQQLKDDGYFKSNIPHIIYRHIELILMFFGGIQCVLYSTTYLGYIIGIVILGIAQGRSGWLQHEANHNSLTRVAWIDRIIGSFWFAMGESGSASWWRKSHNQHHASVQHKGWDVDLETLPFLAYDDITALESNPYIVRFQAYTFVPLTWLIIDYWKFYLHPRHIIRSKCWLDGGLLLFHYMVSIYLCVPSMGWIQTFMTHLLMGHVQGTYLFLNFALSHTHLPAMKKEDEMDWVSKAFHYTVDITGGYPGDWWMGYLNFQTIHHLWPSMPQLNGPKVQPRLQQFAAKHHLQYQHMTYWEAVHAVFSNLNRIGKYRWSQYIDSKN